MYCLGCLSIQIACFDNNNDESMSVCVCLCVWPDKYVCVRKNKCDKIVLLLLLLFTCERASSLFLCVFRRLGIILLAFFATKKTTKEAISIRNIKNLYPSNPWLGCILPFSEGQPEAEADEEIPV